MKSSFHLLQITCIYLFTFYVLKSKKGIAGGFFCNTDLKIYALKKLHKKLSSFTDFIKLLATTAQKRQLKYM